MPGALLSPRTTVPRARACMSVRTRDPRLCCQNIAGVFLLECRGDLRDYHTLWTQLAKRRVTFFGPTVDRLSRLTHHFDKLVFLVVRPPLTALIKFNEMRVDDRD